MDIVLYNLTCAFLLLRTGETPVLPVETKVAQASRLCKSPLYYNWTCANCGFLPTIRRNDTFVEIVALCLSFPHVVRYHALRHVICMTGSDHPPGRNHPPCAMHKAPFFVHEPPPRGRNPLTAHILRKTHKFSLYFNSGSCPRNFQAPLYENHPVNGYRSGFLAGGRFMHKERRFVHGTRGVISPGRYLPVIQITCRSAWYLTTCRNDRPF